ncbi:MAG: MFS transporter [Rhizobiales bacterium]|nr:MFS transporter [Hyphomicrobiales bacterium]
MLQSPLHSVETRSSWVIAVVSLAILSVAFGAPWIITVALKEIAAELGGARSVPALATFLVWFGTAAGGILMGMVAERIGVRWTTLIGALSGAAGLALSTGGSSWQLYVGHGVLIGFFGIGAINAPFYIYISRWFDRRRGSALALISSGGYLAGAIWPPIFERMIAYAGWRQTMLWFAVIEIVVIVPLALKFLRMPPDMTPLTRRPAFFTTSQTPVLGWPPNRVFALVCVGVFLCCTTMAMPQGHLVALCSDLGISATRGAAMLSLLLGTAVICRQVWGLVADRIGGLRTVLIGSAAQAAAMTAFIVAQSELSLFLVSAAFGLGFSGLIPANVLVVRELFPVSEASWRIPTLLLCSGTGMGTGVWLAGVLYDSFGYYGPAFAAGVILNALNFIIIAMLVWRQTVRLAPA